MQNLNNIIAENLVKLRRDKRITQAQLAEMLSYSDKAVSKWERGESMPDIVILKQIADIYGVSVDYLISETHEERVPESTARTIHTNRVIITLLATSLVWLVATAAYALCAMILDTFSRIWLSFIFAIPASCIVLLVFNSLWFNRKFNFAIITALVWSSLLTLYLIFSLEKLWLIFVVGIPAQVIIILWSRLKRVRR